MFLQNAVVVSCFLQMIPFSWFRKLSLSMLNIIKAKKCIFSLRMSLKVPLSNIYVQIYIYLSIYFPLMIITKIILLNQRIFSIKHVVHIHCTLKVEISLLILTCGPGSSVDIATDLRAGLSGIESRWGRDFPPVQTGPAAHPDSCTMGRGSFPGERRPRRGVPPPHLVPRS